MFFKYSRYNFPIRYLICKYFLSFCNLSFALLIVSFDAKNSNIEKVQFISFFVVAHDFWCQILESVAKSKDVNFAFL